MLQVIHKLEALRNIVVVVRTYYTALLWHQALSAVQCGGIRF